jgi:hypothetical protein
MLPGRGVPGESPVEVSPDVPCLTLEAVQINKLAEISRLGHEEVERCGVDKI